MDPNLRRLTYEVNEVPVKDRGPIASFQFKMLDEVKSEATLDILDACDLLALTGRNEDTGVLTFCGACYIARTSLPGRALLVLWWTQEGIPDRAHKALLSALDDWLAKADLESAIGFTCKHPKGWSRTGRFEIERFL